MAPAMEQRPSPPHRPNSVCGHRTYRAATPQAEHRSSSLNRPSSASGSPPLLAAIPTMEQRPGSPSRPNSVLGSRPFLVSPPLEQGPNQPSSVSRSHSFRFATSPREQRPTSGNRPSSVSGYRPGRNLIPLESPAESSTRPTPKLELFSPRKNSGKVLLQRRPRNLVRETNILETQGVMANLGNYEGTNDTARTALRATPSAPVDLEECDKGCYWRSLVHTLLEEVAGVKKTLDEVQTSFSQRSEERNEQQRIIEHHEFLRKDSESLNVTNSTSCAERLRLREERDQLQLEAAQLCDKARHLQEQHLILEDAVQSYRQEQPLFESRVQELEQQIEVQTNNDKNFIECIRHAKGELDQTNAEVQKRIGICDHLQAEIAMYEPAKRKSRRKRAKSPREKKQ